MGPIDAAPDFPLPRRAAPLRAKAERRATAISRRCGRARWPPGAQEMPAKALTLALANEALARFKQMSG